MKKFLSALLALNLLCATPMVSVAQADSIMKDCSQTSAETAQKKREEKYRNNSKLLVTVENEGNQKQKDELFDMLVNCIKYINGSFFSLSGINFSKILEMLVGALIQGACNYAQDKQEELINAVFDKFTYEMPGVGVISPDNTTILGQNFGGLQLTDWDSSVFKTGITGVQDRPVNGYAAANQLKGLGKTAISSGGLPGVFLPFW